MGTYSRITGNMSNSNGNIHEHEPCGNWEQHTPSVAFISKIFVNYLAFTPGEAKEKYSGLCQVILAHCSYHSMTDSRET
jgi:hypothetical protein